MGVRVVRVTDVLDGHAALDVQCLDLDRIYLNAYVMKLQTSAQVVVFLSGHLGYPFPSLFNRIGRPIPPGGRVLGRQQRHPVDQVRQR